MLKSLPFLLSENFQILVVKIPIYLTMRVFVMYGYLNDRNCCSLMPEVVNKRPCNYCMNKFSFRHASAMDDAI